MVKDEGRMVAWNGGRLSTAYPKLSLFQFSSIKDLQARLGTDEMWPARSIGY